jgi:PTS system mannose-specific IIA component
MIIGTQQKLAAVSLNASEGLDDLKEKVKQAIENVNSDKGVLIFTDMYGGSTSIVSSYFLSETVDVLTGINLPMLLEAVLHRERSANVKQLAKLVVEKSRNSIVSMSELHKSCQ